METAEVIVAGGGIIGLSTALELARHGFQVRVLEKGRAMSEASWAAAGMLSPHDPAHPPELARLAELSTCLYPEYLSTVEGLSGRSVRLRTQAAISTDEEDGTSVAISAEEARRRVPGLATEGRSFHWVEEVSLDPRDLCAALPLAVSAAGVVLQEGTEVLSVRGHADSVEITTSRGPMTADAFVNCSGAWAAGIQHPDLLRPPAAGVEPWKGQIFTVRVEPPLDLAYVLRSPEVYLVPRGGGNIVVGATIERVGYDRRVDPLTIRRLQAQAAELWPPIASAPVVESWTGLRPGTSDGLPVIGSAGEPRCWVATGHFRNGILLAPATGLIVRQLLQHSQPAVGIEAFAPGRPSK
ncbi:MAG: glycine oxidase [Acidobacteriaceae bacterium]|nr:glycine oxidase [Acidobacteriaceae bacterium]